MSEENLGKALEIIKAENYQVSNLEKFSSLYFYLHSLKKKIEELEGQVRKKGSEMMSDGDIKKIGYQDYEILRIDPTETEKYCAKYVIEGLGLERALPFLKVDSYISTYLKKASAMGAVTMDEISICRSGITKTHKKGYLKIQRKKA